MTSARRASSHRPDWSAGAVSAAARPPATLSRIAQVTALAAVSLAQIAVMPQAGDGFRLPKTLVFHVAGLLVCGLIAIGLLLGRNDYDLIRKSAADRLLAAIVVWTLISLAFSQHRMLSAFALVSVLSAAALFLALRQLARRVSPGPLVAAIIVPAVVNSLLVMAQRFAGWNPLVPEEIRGRRESVSALIGNPNDVGTVLVPALVVACCWGFACGRPRLRVATWMAAATILAGILLTETRTAIAAAFVALAAVVVLQWRMRGAFVVGVVGVIALVAVARDLPLVRRFSARVDSATIASVSSGRMIPFAAAVRMIRDSPLTGIGPGCFKLLYEDYADDLYVDMRQYVIAGPRLNFGEAHNDHLQVAAETGLPGYALFLAALYLTARESWRWREPRKDERSHFVHLCALPSAMALAMLAMFQFPLELAASLVAFVFCAAISLSRSDADANVAT